MPVVFIYHPNHPGKILRMEDTKQPVSLSDIDWEKLDCKSYNLNYTGVNA